MTKYFILTMMVLFMADRNAVSQVTPTGVDTGRAIKKQPPENNRQSTKVEKRTKKTSQETAAVDDGDTQETTRGADNGYDIGFTYLNAVNFDFSNSKGGNYVGHLNVWNYDAVNNETTTTTRALKLKKDGGDYKNNWRIGYNCGIMKTDYASKGPLDTSYDYDEKVLMHPLDEIKVGNQYFKQYNKLTNESRNVTWSAYIQPTLSLYYKPNIKVLLNGHVELFVDEWTTTTTIKNYQQEAFDITDENIDTLKSPGNVNRVNKFEGSLSDPFISTVRSQKTTLNFGMGVTFDMKIPGIGSLFVQPTVYVATLDSDSPQGIDKNTLQYITAKRSKWAHLGRIYLNINLTDNASAIVGVNIRGKFNETPTHSFYVGANLGLDGIKELIK